MNTTYTTMNSRKYILFALLLSSTMVCAQQKKAKPIARKNVRNAATANPMNARQQENFNAMLPNTQSIFVVDSTIVDKNRVCAFSLAHLHQHITASGNDLRFRMFHQERYCVLYTLRFVKRL